MKKVFSVLCSGLLLAGCVPDLVKLDPQYNQASRANRAGTVSSAASCQVILLVEDGRTEDDVKSGFGWKMVQSPDVVGWLQSGVMSLASKHYQFVMPNNRNELADRQFRMHVKLRKMYIMSLNTSKSSTVVVSVELFNAEGKPVGQTTARGNDTSVNWAFGEGEINSAFRTSLEQTLEKIDQYVEGQCKAPRTA